MASIRPANIIASTDVIPIPAHDAAPYLAASDAEIADAIDARAGESCCGSNSPTAIGAAS